MALLQQAATMPPASSPPLMQGLQHGVGLPYGTGPDPNLVAALNAVASSAPLVPVGTTVGQVRASTYRNWVIDVPRSGGGIRLSMV